LALVVVSALAGTVEKYNERKLLGLGLFWNPDPVVEFAVLKFEDGRFEFSSGKFFVFFGHGGHKGHG
jgi:hypothetical protein